MIRYAQKTCSNLHILQLIRKQGVRVDAVSLGEIERALLAGYSPAGIVFTCDLFDEATLRRVVELNIEVNTGSIDMLRQLGEQSAGHRVWLRINPGFGMVTAAKPIRVEKTASMASGMTRFRKRSV